MVTENILESAPGKEQPIGGGFWNEEYSWKEIIPGGALGNK